MFEEIAKQIRCAALDRRKVAMFHYQVLKNAKKLENINSQRFCEEVGMEDSFTTEFKKMISLAKLS